MVYDCCMYEDVCKIYEKLSHEPNLPMLTDLQLLKVVRQNKAIKVRENITLPFPSAHCFLVGEESGGCVVQCSTHDLKAEDSIPAHGS